MKYLEYLSKEMEASARLRGQLREYEYKALDVIGEALDSGDRDMARWVVEKGLVEVSTPKMGMVLHQRMVEEEMSPDGERIRGLGGVTLSKSELEAFIVGMVESDSMVREEKKLLGEVIDVG
jgi:hypothetical protein